MKTDYTNLAQICTVKIYKVYVSPKKIFK